MIRRILSLVLIVWLLGLAWFVVSLPRPAGDAKTDAIVVLTGGPGRIQRGLDQLARGQDVQLERAVDVVRADVVAWKKKREPAVANKEGDGKTVTTPK